MNYHWQIERGDDTLEGWCRVSLEMDDDGDFRSMDIEAIEVEPSPARCMKIQRGYVPVEDRPTDAATDAIVVDHLNGEALGEIIELWEATEHYQERHGHQWSGMC